MTKWSHGFHLNVAKGWNRLSCVLYFKFQNFYCLVIQYKSYTVRLSKVTRSALWFVQENDLLAPRKRATVTFIIHKNIRFLKLDLFWPYPRRMGGWDSSQDTIIALEAIINFTKGTKKQSKEMTVNINSSLNYKNIKITPASSLTYQASVITVSISRLFRFQALEFPRFFIEGARVMMIL